MRRWTPGHRAGAGHDCRSGCVRWRWRVACLSAGDAADYRGHDTRQGHPEDPPASETGSRPAPDRSGACLPGRLCLVLRLTAPGGSLNRPRQPSSGPEPEVAPRAAREWGRKAVLLRAPPAHPAVPVVESLSPSRRAPRPHACAPVSRSCSLPHRVHQSQPPPLRSAYSVARAFASVSSSSSHRV